MFNEISSLSLVFSFTLYFLCHVSTASVLIYPDLTCTAAAASAAQIGPPDCYPHTPGRE